MSPGKWTSLRSPSMSSTKRPTRMSVTTNGSGIKKSVTNRKLFVDSPRKKPSSPEPCSSQSLRKSSALIPSSSESESSSAATVSSSPKRSPPRRRSTRMKSVPMSYLQFVTPSNSPISPRKLRTRASTSEKTTPRRSDRNSDRTPNKVKQTTPDSSPSPTEQLLKLVLSNGHAHKGSFTNGVKARATPSSTRSPARRAHNNDSLTNGNGVRARATPKSKRSANTPKLLSESPLLEVETPETNVVTSSTKSVKKSKVLNKSLLPEMDKPETNGFPLTPLRKYGFGKKTVNCPVPCRNVEFQKIWTFMKSNLEASESGCIYVSGVPGTGKTLVVKAVVSALDKLAEESTSADFKHVYINGLSLSAPLKIWNRLYQSIMGKRIKISSANALLKLEKFFKGKHAPVILIVDELDQLLERQQNILYRLLEWSSDNSALFSFIAIFNTINLPEKVMALKNVSRLGLDRVVFTSYTHDQLGEILLHYLGEEKTKRLGEATILISRKVAAVSGDARRALEIAKRALEIMSSKEISGIKAVNETFKELFSAPKLQALECCSTLEQKILKAIATDCQSSGQDDTALSKIVNHIRATCLLDGFAWTIDQILSACRRLFTSKLILLENEKPTMFKKVQLNVPVEDLNFVFNFNNDMN